MSDTPLPLPEGLRWIKLVCRLGRLAHDGVDADDKPDLLPTAGKVRLASSPARLRVQEADGRWRSVSLDDREYSVRPDGELVDTEGRVGVWIPDPASELLDPRPYTLVATVLPTVGERWAVKITGETLPDVVDLVAHSETVAVPASAVPGLSSRIAALEGILAAGGTGSGIRNVSGTVDLDATPGIYEVYALDAATVNGVELAAGDAAVFRYLSGSWSWMIVGQHTTWQAGSGTTGVTATAPTFTDADGTASDTYTIPTTAGVDYRVEGVIKAAGTYPATGTVTIQATPASEDVSLVGTVSWTHTFSAGTVENWTTQVLSAAFTEADGTNATGSIYYNPDHAEGPELYAGYTDETGHFWQGTAPGVAIQNGLLATNGTSTAYARHGVTGDYSLRAKVQVPASVNTSIAGRRAESATPAKPSTASADGHSVVITPTEISFGYASELAINFNVSGPGSRAPHGLGAGQWATLRFDMLGTVGTLWVNGSRMFEVDFAGTSTKLGSGDYITLTNGAFDDVELWTA